MSSRSPGSRSGAGDLYHLTFGQTQSAGFDSGSHLVLGEYCVERPFNGSLCSPAPADAAKGRRKLQQNVFAYCQIRTKREFLMHDPNTENPRLLR